MKQDSSSSAHPGATGDGHRATVVGSTPTGEESLYLIFSSEHTFEDAAMWWRPNSCGYTEVITEAGRYTYEEARKICHNVAEPENEHMIPESIAVGLALPTVFLDRVRTAVRKHCPCW